ncbi:hypothetical protein FB567DRAFT_514424 [Paraphoma chrysanthemicola]|uniref:F-box domain-containing protein n=1 Tax=Paraphoma chrysanthemicola TaxID=798071 RepID=A0A8K0REQ4_9PLEO|nr:hypothetical protein FB567DRAFT_514424 [Paraphoma chrysanthemicola]
MNSLPPELHLQILSYLSPPDHINYRIISTRSADVAASLVFAIYEYKSSIHDISRLKALLTPHLAQHIKALHYSDETDRQGRKYGHANAFNIQLHTVVELLVQNGATLSSLTASSLPYWFFAPDTSNHIDSFTQSCSRVTHLSLDIRWYVSETYTFSDVIQRGTLRSVIASMQCLSELVLKFGPETPADKGVVGGYRGMGMYTGPRPRVSEVLPVEEMAWGRLKKLEMWFVSATVGELVGLWGLCAASVWELDFAGVALCEVDGRKIVDYENRVKEAWRRVVKGLERCEVLRRVSLRERTKNTALDERRWCVRGKMGMVMLETDVNLDLTD